nr:hypothetical protein [Micromonospora sp. DSM 115978]
MNLLAEPQTWTAASGALAGLGVYLLLRCLTTTTAPGDAAGSGVAGPGTLRRAGWAAEANRRVERLLGRSRA